MNRYEWKLNVRKPVMTHLPIPYPKVIYGKNSRFKILDLLKKDSIHKICIFSSHTVYQSGALDKILEGLMDKDVVLVHKIPSDPGTTCIDQLAEKAKGCQAVLAIGGGSVIDAAKAVCGCLAEQKECRDIFGTMKIHHKPPLLMACPTTAGTGSEGTVAAVITDDQSHLKRQILDLKLVPDYAVLDSQLTMSLPASITAQTAMDALTHALEAYVSTYATKTTDRYATLAIRLILDKLPYLLEDGQNERLRQDLLIAAYFAGLAFTRAYVGYVHAYAHAIGARYHIPHGQAVAELLPYVMEYYVPVCDEKLSSLAIQCGIGQKDKDSAANAMELIDAIHTLNKKGRIPSYVENFPEEDIPIVIKQAFRECHGNYPVPRYYNEQAARNLLEKVCAR